MEKTLSKDCRTLMPAGTCGENRVYPGVKASRLAIYLTATDASGDEIPPLPTRINIPTPYGNVYTKSGK